LEIVLGKPTESVVLTQIQYQIQNAKEKRKKEKKKKNPKQIQKFQSLS